ncbi:hypothetical protein ACSBR2_005883 [Camellia fascicularis]
MSMASAPPMSASPRDDAMQLHRAFKGFGCDATTVVNILAQRNAMQRPLIQLEFRTLYSEDLNKRLSSELSGDVKKAVLLWMQDPAGRDATVVRQALSGNKVNVRVATEVICSRTSHQIQQFKQAYLAIFGAYLEHDIEHQASGDHKKMLLAYVAMPRYEGPEIDTMIVENDAKALYKAGEKRIGTDEKTFIRIFSERSRAHLAAVNSAYHKMYGHSLEKAIKKETSGNFTYALLTVLQCVENPGKFFAKGLHKAMKGMGTDETSLTRIIVTRAEIDMQYIKAEYHKKYGKSLNDAVQSETSGPYKAFLLSLIGPNH